MSFQELLAELPSLTGEQRQALRVRLSELEGDGWIDDGELSPEEKRVIEERLAEHERNPDAAISWEVAEAKLRARYGL